MNMIQGHFNYQGKHTTQQVSNIKSFFENLLVKEKFEIIIELGTSMGGLTYIIDDIIKENNLLHNIHTFDFSHKDYVETFLKERNCFYHILDERDEEYKNKVIDLLTNYGKALLLCDGGNKIEEFNRYSKYLKINDIIMAHDYCESKEIFELEIKDKIWNWCEITFSDIENSIKEQNLIKYPEFSFKEAVWACYKKQ